MDGLEPATRQPPARHFSCIRLQILSRTVALLRCRKKRDNEDMTEEQAYDVLADYPDFELRSYPEHVVAETHVRGSFEGAGNVSLRRLIGYISGRNTRSQKVDMTAPVLQEAEDEKTGSYVVSFVMPGGFDLRDSPEPTDSEVRRRTIPPQTAAALSFSGR